MCSTRGVSFSEVRRASFRTAPAPGVVDYSQESNEKSFRIYHTIDIIVCGVLSGLGAAIQATPGLDTAYDAQS